jgi:hypothetical protein
MSIHAWRAPDVQTELQLMHLLAVPLQQGGSGPQPMRPSSILANFTNSTSLTAASAAVGCCQHAAACHSRPLSSAAGSSSSKTRTAKIDTHAALLRCLLAGGPSHAAMGTAGMNYSLWDVQLAKHPAPAFKAPSSQSSGALEGQQEAGVLGQGWVLGRAARIGTPAPAPGNDGSDRARSNSVPPAGQPHGRSADADAGEVMAGEGPLPVSGSTPDALLASLAAHFPLNDAQMRVARHVASWLLRPQESQPPTSGAKGAVEVDAGVGGCDAGFSSEQAPDTSGDGLGATVPLQPPCQPPVCLIHGPVSMN